MTQTHEKKKTNPSITKAATLLMESLSLQYCTKAKDKFFLLYSELAGNMKEQHWIRWFLS